MDEILEIYTFGGLQIRRGRDSTVTFRTSKGAALAVYLVCTGQPHPREVLAEMFWPERTSEAAHSNLRATLADFRKQVGSASNISRNMVGLLPSPQCWVDVQALEGGLDGFGELDQTPAAVLLLQETLVLYQGDFLSGFYVNSAEFENWAALERERLRNRVMSAFDALILYHRLNSENSAGLARASELLRIDPLREKTIRHLMHLHAQSGDRAAALYQFDSWRTKLLDELDLEPEAETITLYNDIKEGRLTPTNTSLEARATYMSEAKLPHPLTPFVGREDEIAVLIDLLTSPGAHLITILGPGGMGKTRLAITVAETVLLGIETSRYFADGIVFVSLDAAPGTLLSTLASAVGLSASTSQESLFDFLKSRQMLIILDNFDSSLNGESFISELLDAASTLYLLITSREPVNMYGEQLFPISGLSLPDSSEITQGEAAAVRLLLQSARRSNPLFRLQTDETGTVAALCRALDGIPLAIELAASWTRLLPLAEILSEIQRSLDFLETDLRDVPERHRSMRVVFASVWERLSQDERTVFAELALFAGGFSRDAAQGVTGCSLRILTALVNKSLVQYDTEAERYRIHDLLVQFCTQKRASDPDWDYAARDKHSAFFCHWLKEQENDFSTARESYISATIERDARNIVAAWDWAVEQGNVSRLLEVCTVMGKWCDNLARFIEGETAFSSVVTWLQTVLQPTVTQRYLLASALSWQGVFGQRLHRANDGLRHLLQQSKDILEALPTDEYSIRQQKAYTLMQLAYLSPPNQARQLQETSLDLFRRLGDQRGEVLILQAIGFVELRANNFAAAETWLTQSLSLCQQLNMTEAIEAVSANLSKTLYAQRKFVDVDRLIDTLLTNNWTLVSTPRHLFAVALLMLVHGRFSDGLSLANECLDIAEQQRLHHLTPFVFALRSQCALHLGQYDTARTDADSALRLAELRDKKRSAGYSLDTLSCLALSQGKLAQARQLAEDILALSLANYKNTAKAISLAIRASTWLLLEQTEPARQHLIEALELAVTYYDYPALTHVLPTVAFLYAVEDKWETAVEIYSLALQQPFVEKSIWFNEVIGTRIRSKAEAKLSVSVIRSAEARGREGEIWHRSAEVLTELALYGQKTSSTGKAGL